MFEQENLLSHTIIEMSGLSVIAAAYKLTHMNMKYNLSPNVYTGGIFFSYFLVGLYRKPTSFRSW